MERGAWRLLEGEGIYLSHIAVLDFGSQYTLLIVRRIRELGVESRVYPGDVETKELKDVGGIILSGGPGSVYEEDALLPSEGIFGMGVPILGICYGMQAIAQMLGGKVRAVGKKEFGDTEFKVVGNSRLFYGMPGEFKVWMSHGDEVVDIPVGFVVSGRTKVGKVASIEDPRRKFYGLQFHPEVVHTPLGMDVLSNFVFGVCGLSKNWSMRNFVESKVKELKSTLTDGNVVCGISGGVDSTTAAVLVSRAIGERLVSIFVNNGLLRKNEEENVLRILRDELGLNVVYVDASSRFLNALSGVVDPEEKRKIIGKEFVDVFEEVAMKIKGVKYLLQGTLYPDVIESGAGGFKAHRIKSHHNVGGLPEKMKLQVVEPFRYLFKDEVRKVAAELGIPDFIINRHPFPGPGLAVRIIGSITVERLNILKEADRIVEDEIREAGLYTKVWQAFAVLLPVKTVGVKGDRRSYENAIVIRVVDSKDGMTADWVKLPYQVLERMSSRIINEVKGVNRVVYDVSTKPPSTIEWE